MTFRSKIYFRYICADQCAFELLLRYCTKGRLGVSGEGLCLCTISGFQKCFRFQNEYDKVEIELRVVQIELES